MSRLTVLVLFGGRSAEHGVSCLSAANVVAALEAGGHRVVLVGITREGRWVLADAVPSPPPGRVPEVSDDGDTVAIVAGRKGPRLVRFPADPLAQEPAGRVSGEEIGPVDVCFPVLHGPYGEDGTVQGLLATLGIPYVGSGVAASAVGIDKRQMKNVFKARGLPQVPYLTVRSHQWHADRGPLLDDIEAALGYPVYTKPARQGSSIGISKCRGRDELISGISDALGYDRVVVVEQGLDGVRELECGVLGDTSIRVAGPGEVVTAHEFYDFSGKYLDDGLVLRSPADVSADVTLRCREMAREAYQAIGARGMARVDFFLVPSAVPGGAEPVLVNEINTIPGFTSASMYPYVWQVEGLDAPALVDELLDLAMATATGDGHHSP